MRVRMESAFGLRPRSKQEPTNGAKLKEEASPPTFFPTLEFERTFFEASSTPEFSAVFEASSTPEFSAVFEASSTLEFSAVFEASSTPEFLAVFEAFCEDAKTTMKRDP
jgi:hypothetical protein